MADYAEISSLLQKGQAPKVKELCQAALDEGAAPGEILEQGLIDGMSVIGAKFKKNDLWVFDVISMNQDGIELCQVKGALSRGEQERIREWLRENHDRLPENLKCICAYEDEELGTFRIVEVTP